MVSRICKVSQEVERMGWATLESNLVASLLKYQTCMPYDLGLPFLGLLPKDTQPLLYRGTGTTTFFAPTMCLSLC